MTTNSVAIKPTLAKGPALIVGTSLLMYASGAFAQSSVTLYGVIDEAVRYTTNNATASGPKSRTFLSDGALNGSRFGLRGTEDLGGGNSAIFVLENGYSLANGALGQQGQMFGRQAYVGLANQNLGTVKFGRQYGAAFSYLALFDPVGTGNVPEDDWDSFLPGLRFDNTVDYSNTWGGLGVEGQYSIGGQAGNVKTGRTFQFASTYANGPLSLGGAVQNSQDARERGMLLWSVGGKYTFAGLTGYLYYINSRRDAGFSIGASGTSNPLANTSIGGNANTVLGANTQTESRKDNLVTVGFSYQATPSIKFITAYMHDNVLGVSPGVGGKIQTAYLVGMYSLSKRTDVYAEVDHSLLSGGSRTDPNGPLANFGGAGTRTGAALGLRHRF